jgi:transcriptional regulator with GAF, ATPase, and Fis domain/tetratricopeptide (TPR) repeat protein
MAESSEVPSELAQGWCYRLECPAGRGATAQVWRALQLPSGRPVALKVAAESSGAAQMADEAEALLGASSPGIPSLLGLGRVPAGVAELAEGRPYVALSWVAGTRLEPRTAASPEARARLGLAIAADVGSALWRLHEAGVAHGDIKPSNILCVDGDSQHPRASLVDLGFSVRLDAGALRGATPRYLSPQGVHGSACARDLWALGVVLAEVVSGQVAEAAEPAAAIARACLPAPFDVWCRALTATDPGARPSAAWLAAVAGEYAGRSERESEAWRVRASYLRVRRRELRAAACAARLEVDEQVAPWFREALGVMRTARQLRGGGDSGPDVLCVGPMDAWERARWLVALVGEVAAGWRIQGPLLAMPEQSLASSLEQLARAAAPRAWSLRDVMRVVEPQGGLPSARMQLESADELELALALNRKPAATLAVEEAEHRMRKGQLGERVGLLLADALRARGELGRALVVLAQRQEPAARAMRAEVLRRMGDAEAAAREAQAVDSDESEASDRARAVLARVRLDQGEPRLALSTAGEPRSASACEVRALAYLALGEREPCLREAELGLALAADEETRARLTCVLGMHAHAAGDAEAAREAFGRAVDHAVRAGAVIEEATYLTGEASAAVLAGMIQQALAASQRASLLWEHLGRRDRWAYALLSRAGALSLAGARVEASRTAAAARELAREAGDDKAQLYGWMVSFDVAEPRSDAALEAARRAWELAKDGGDEESLCRTGARMLLCGALGEEDTRGLDAASARVGTAARWDWWGARAAALRAGVVAGRAPEILGHLERLARQPGPIGSKGPSLHEGRMLAEERGDGEAARLFAAEQGALGAQLLASAPPDLRDSVAAVPWVRSGQSRAEPSVSGVQARNLEVLVRALAQRDNLRSLLEQVLDSLVLWTGVERGLLLLRAPDDRLVVRAARNLGRRDLLPDQLGLSQTLALRALASREPVVAVDAAGEISEVHASVHALGLRSVLAVPLLARGEVLGVAYLDDRVRAGAFGPQELSWVKLLALVAAVAIADARDQLLLRRAARQAERAQRKLAQNLAQREAELDVASAELARVREGRDTRYRYDELVGRSEPMRQMLQLVDRVTPTSVPVLIVGESGSGKELVARALHRNGPRSSQPFVSENCSAIPESLLESTLFGHVKGAFTSADRNRIGLFESAHGGTLFLDEIGEMSLGMQSKLLRTLQDGEVHPVGSSRSRKVDVRVIAATHRDLATLVKEARFREDLMYRLNVIAIPVPSLRERREDIEVLARHFVARHSMGRKVRITPEAMARLAAHDWPGNVRQLENEMRRALVLCDEVIRPEHLSAEVAAQARGARATGLDLRSRVDDLEKQLVGEALGRTRGNQTQAAKLLGLSRFGLQKMIRRLGVDGD